MSHQPIIVDLGKQRSKDIKAFKRGEGALMLEVQQAIGQVRQTNGEGGKEIVPVVIVYQEKPKRRRLGFFG